MGRRFDFLVAGTAGVDTNVYLGKSELGGFGEGSINSTADLPGGAGFYVAACLAAFGWRVAYLGFVGEDATGEQLRAAMAALGIHCQWHVDPAGTRRSVNLMRPDGSRRNFYDGRGSMQVCPSERELEEAAQLAPCAWLCIENWCRRLIPQCAQIGTRIVTDLHDAPHQADPYRADFLASAETVFASAANMPSPARYVAGVRKFGISAPLLIGCGARGAALALQGAPLRRYPPIRMAGGTDEANGAGDILACGVITARERGFGWDDSLRIGQTAARYSCGRRTIGEKLLSWDQLLAFCGLAHTSQ